jgi:hypothetical protein
VAKVRKQEIFFYVAVVVLFAFVGLEAWLRVDPGLGTRWRQLMGAVQIGLAAIFLALLLLSFRRPLRRENRSIPRKPEDPDRRKPPWQP